ncbi:hypothetical protein H696_01518 [Fonticula alba]|uniref:Uncharacterized protein n=1 Tax=Fonticula alba TaxID=691883 RepID=A0A058ZF51_FONAL|nr:hypothetical protein H696_01518 [Fonticula alba]KCV72112.1 hypothetical protein H696_01518 [Fonticula alba]|eukprot:XP_009493690.1 hypothetical protein H696_01518 [Fonticula alba]
MGQAASRATTQAGAAVARSTSQQTANTAAAASAAAAAAATAAPRAAAATAAPRATAATADPFDASSHVDPAESLLSQNLAALDMTVKPVAESSIVVDSRKLPTRRTTTPSNATFHDQDFDSHAERDLLMSQEISRLNNNHLRYILGRLEKDPASMDQSIREVLALHDLISVSDKGLTPDNATAERRMKLLDSGQLLDGPRLQSLSTTLRSDIELIDAHFTDFLVLKVPSKGESAEETFSQVAVYPVAQSASKANGQEQAK